MASTPWANVAPVRHFPADGILSGDIDTVGGVCIPDVDVHEFVSGDTHGRATGPRLGRQLAVADGDVGVADAVATDDRVAVRGAVTGIHRVSPPQPTTRPHPRVRKHPRAAQADQKQLDCRDPVAARWPRAHGTTGCLSWGTSEPNALQSNRTIESWLTIPRIRWAYRHVNCPSKLTVIFPR